VSNPVQGAGYSDGSQPHPDVIASVLVGVAGHIGYTPLGPRLGWADGHGGTRSLLVGRFRKETADTAAARATLGTVVPHYLASDGAVQSVKAGAPQASA
jgi:hypothetical protein